MQEFDELKHIWQQSIPEKPAPKMPDLAKASAQTKKKLQNEQRNGAVCLLLTAAFIAALAIWGGFDFEHWYTYAAMALVCLICLSQAFIMLSTYLKVKRINDTAAPRKHLAEWEAYYTFRQRQLKWNKPLYFVLLNLAMGLYLIEVLDGASATFLLVFGTIYVGWMIFAYLIMGKRLLKRERNRIESVIAELHNLSKQLSE
ncbi:hypothetical protein ACFSRY_05795 [Pontibacter locisalis]|uniref:Uncharacterized protein n=1 Tax=Pontibacter locisalis TaxID=1719035 RepID=A0ABW5IK68_9BACT